MIALARATSSLSSPVRSGPNRMPRFSPPPRRSRPWRRWGSGRPSSARARAPSSRKPHGGRRPPPRRSERPLRGVQQIGRARRGGIGDFAIFVGARPALARIDQAQIVEAEIGHGARAHADVHGELRPNQNDRRTAAERRSRPVRARANHRGRAIARRRPRQSIARFTLYAVSDAQLPGRPARKRIGQRDHAAMVGLFEQGLISAVLL